MDVYGWNERRSIWDRIRWDAIIAIALSISVLQGCVNQIVLIPVAIAAQKMAQEEVNQDYKRGKLEAQSVAHQFILRQVGSEKAKAFVNYLRETTDDRH